MLNRLTLTSQFMILIVVALIVVQGINVVLLFGDRQLTSRAQHAQDNITVIVDLAALVPEDIVDRELPYRFPHRLGPRGATFVSVRNRAVESWGTSPVPKLEADLRAALDAAGVSYLNVAVGERNHDDRDRLRPAFVATLENEGPGGAESDRVRPSTPPGGHPQAFKGLEENILSVELQPGIWINRMAPFYPAPAIGARVFSAMALATLIVGGIAFLVARRLGKPLRKLAEASDALGRGRDAEQVEPGGTVEMRQTIQAFNTMQDRLLRLIETQRFTLRAMSHDLRSPLTTLRFRAETLEDPVKRDQIVTSLKEMRDIVDEVLEMSKDASATEPVDMVDLASLSKSLVDDYADQGLPVSYAGAEDAVVLPCRRMAIRRALTNLIDNALRYGGKVTVGSKRSDDAITLFVQDDGPGITEADLERLLLPFEQGRGPSEAQSGGYGLGLSIIRSIMEVHGGKLDLSNAPPGGLRANLVLPMA